MDRMLELSGMRVEDGEGHFPVPDGGVKEPSEYQDDVRQQIGPLTWDGHNDEPVYMDITPRLLSAWAEEHGCDLDSVRVVLHPGNFDLRQEIHGRKTRG